MKKYEYYHVTITAKAPIFVGTRERFSKKEYIFDTRQKKVIIPQFEKMYFDIKKRGLERQFQSYMINENENLYKWLMNNKFSEKDYMKWKKYELDCGDAIIDRKRPLEICAIVKDAYGNPYIPGSSLKGMLRTVLLAYNMMENPEKYKGLAYKVEEESKKYAKRPIYLKNSAMEIERTGLYTLKRDMKERHNMVNDMMSDIIVSDSKPLAISDLTLCQKIDVHTDGRQRKFNLLRESLKPDTKIEFEMKVSTDTGVTENMLLQAVAAFGDMYYNSYIKKFAGSDRPSDDTVWLGGGVGFVTKTIIYPMYKQNIRKGLHITDAILKTTLNKKYREHKHYLNVEKGVAPHIMKMTQNKGKLYNMGEASIAFEKVNVEI